MKQRGKENRQGTQHRAGGTEVLEQDLLSHLVAQRHSQKCYGGGGARLGKGGL